MKKFYKLFAFIFICVSLYGLLGFIAQYLPLKTESEQYEEILNYEPFETWGNDLTEDELKQYYIENSVYPASAPPDTSSILDGRAKVANNLEKRFPAYKNWSKTQNSRDVGDVFKRTINDTRDFNPKEIWESSDIMQNAKRNAHLHPDYAIGCGPLAMVSQFEFLARYAGYQVISPRLYSKNDIVPFDQYDPAKAGIISDDEVFGLGKLAKEIFENTSTLAIDDSGTFTFPEEVIDSSRELLERYGLAVSYNVTKTDENGNETTTKYYSSDESAIFVSGDCTANLSSFDTKINNLKRSINKGMPVIWWTLGNAGDFKNHFMNIYGYEYWKGTDNNGIEKTHLMFKLRVNWGVTDEVFMDSDLLKAINGGFIYFSETRKKASVRPSDYNYACRYNFQEESQTVVPSVGEISFQTKRLRTGYVNHYDNTNTTVDGQYLTMSPDRKDAGVAYLEYSTSQSICRINLELCWWGNSEGLTPITGTVLIQYKTGDNTWETAIDLQATIPGIPSYYLSPQNYTCFFDNPTTTFRIYVACADTPTSNKNKGRLVIGNMIAYYGNPLSINYSVW